MSINFTNKENIDAFVNDNIELINNKISEFNKKNNTDLIFDKTDIRRHLKKKFDEYISNCDNKLNLIKCFESKKYLKKEIVNIAIEIKLYHTDLENFYKKIIFEDLSKIDDKKISNSIIDAILTISDFDKDKKKYAKLQLNPIVDKVVYILLKNGFTFNLSNNEEGLMMANAGDSAQFLFLARAILAGYNCSNVDVRSSRYDAVIDKNGKLFRVQVKGTSGTTVSFKDRDRGGRGIDNTNERNKGKRITSEDCDLYVAVDKQIGICYIIPTKDIDVWNVDCKNTKELLEYKENWQKIDELGEN